VSLAGFYPRVLISFPKPFFLFRCISSLMKFPAHFSQDARPTNSDPPSNFSGCPILSLFPQDDGTWPFLCEVSSFFPLFSLRGRGSKNISQLLLPSGRLVIPRILFPTSSSYFLPAALHLLARRATFKPPRALPLLKYYPKVPFTLNSFSVFFDRPSAL